MNKSCRYCGRTHPLGEVCVKKPAHNHNADDKNAAFRRTNAWRVKSKETMTRDLYLCRVCLKKGEINTEQLSVHHITPLSERFDKRLADDNLITLCDDCHRRAEIGSITRKELINIAAGTVILPNKDKRRDKHGKTL